MKSKIKHFIMDVDGTLTDGKIYFSSNGEMFKAFNVKDGYGIAHMLKTNGIEPIIITGRQSKIVEQRARELGILKIYQGRVDKLPIVGEAIGTDGLETCAYMGDDIPDLECMMQIKGAGGLTGCPVDAGKEVQEICDFISPKCGGDGAVRDFIEWILGSYR